jgi:hypothetical protein
VLVQVGLEGEGLVAALAVVVLESGMGLHVSSGIKKTTIKKKRGLKVVSIDRSHQEMHKKLSSPVV